MRYGKTHLWGKPDEDRAYNTAVMAAHMLIDAGESGGDPLALLGRALQEAVQERASGPQPHDLKAVDEREEAEPGTAAVIASVVDMTKALIDLVARRGEPADMQALTDFAATPKLDDGWEPSDPELAIELLNRAFGAWLNQEEPKDDPGAVDAV